MENKNIIYIVLFLLSLILFFSFFKCESFGNFQKPKNLDYINLNIDDYNPNTKIQNMIYGDLRPETTLMNTKDKKIITLYYANWCSHCHHVLPFYNQLMEENDNNDIIYKKIENDELINNPEEMSKINGYPTILVNYKEKEYIYNGYRDKTSLIKYINDLS
jgi:hypothetical protein